MKRIIEKIHIPRENMMHLIVSVLIIVLFVSGVIIPEYVKRMRMEQRIRDIREQINEHSSLQPLYEDLKKSSGPETVTLAVSPARLQKDNIDMALAALREISGKSAMKIISLTPDLSGTSRGPNCLVLNMSLIGNFSNFRNVLSGIGRLPYVDSIEDLSIQREPGARMMAFKIRVIVSLS